MVQQLEVNAVPKVQDEMLEGLKELTRPQVTSTEAARPQPQFKRQIVWFNALGFLAMHIVGVYAFYSGFTQATWPTLLWLFFLMVASGEGVTMGAHRMYSHKAFKANAGLRFALVMLQTLAGQNCLYIWVRDHRQHHKWSDTDADPHNARRGFFFSHIGWLMCRKHPDVISKGKTIDLSDLEADPFVMFQKKYYKTLYVILAMGLPTMIPYWCWGEDLMVSFMVSYLFRTVFTLNATWLVNSAAHKYGTRPFSKDIVPVESYFVSSISMGEGWHNYHHSFPWDYKAAELGAKFNFTAWLIERFSHLGWTYDLRSASHGMIQHRVLTRGDGTHPSIKPVTDPEELKESLVQATELKETHAQATELKEEPTPATRLTRRPGF